MCQKWMECRSRFNSCQIMGGSSRVSASPFPLPTQCSPPWPSPSRGRVMHLPRNLRLSDARWPPGRGQPTPPLTRHPSREGIGKTPLSGGVARRDGVGSAGSGTSRPRFRRAPPHGICIIRPWRGGPELVEACPEQSGAKSKGAGVYGPGSLVFPYRGVLGSPPPRQWFRYPGMPRAGPSADRKAHFDHIYGPSEIA